MKKNKWLMIGLVLTLALTMVWAVPVLAQGRGRGQGGQGWGCGGQGQGQGYGQGYGQGSGTCPNYQGYQNCPANYGNSPQANMGRRGPRGAGRMYQPQPQTQPSPPATQ
jgi:hypothetical protein